VALLFNASKTANGCAVFDTSTNSIILVNEQEYECFTHFDQCKDNSGFLEKFQSKGFLKEINIREIRHFETDYLNAFLNRKQEMITFQLTQRCNLRCTYCPYSATGNYGHRNHSDASMSIETAKKAIDFFLSNAVDSSNMHIGFYGGEPLLEFELIKICINYIENEYSDCAISYGLTTNGTLLTMEKYKYLSSKGFNIIVSIDGPKPIHDRYRVFFNGSGSYDVIMANLEKIRSNYPESSKNIAINTVFGPQQDDLCNELVFSNLDDVKHYNNISMSLLSNLYLDTPYQYSEAFGATYQRELCKLLLYLVGKIRLELTSKVISSTISTYDREYHRLFRMEKFPEVLHPSGTCIPGADRLFVNVYGDLYTCEKVSERSSKTRIGNIESGIAVEKVKELLNIGSLVSDHCKKCWVIFHCSICALAADGIDELSADRILRRCKQIRFQYQELLKALLFLKKNGYSFNWSKKMTKEASLEMD